MSAVNLVYFKTILTFIALVTVY